MANKTGYAMFCVLLVLASWAKYGETGSLHIFNGANDMAIQHTIEFYNGTVTTEPAQALLKSTNYQLEVVPGITCVHTKYIMGTNSLVEQQYLPSWCTVGLPFVCYDCYWLVDSTGFSVAPSPTATLQFVATWRT